MNFMGGRRQRMKRMIRDDVWCLVDIISLEPTIIPFSIIVPI